MIKVAGYCRVSTDQEDQANSFVSQKRFFRDYIENHPGWELYEIYADEGITGTSTKKRVQFNRMIRDASEGCFHTIITKEVSRFSRNILDTIAYTRELKARGIGVLFLNDGIYTMDPDAELRLSIMGSIAQEESRRTSSRVVWGQTRQMERGIVFGRSLLGYDVKGGILTVNPAGAELVRLIFHKYGVEQAGTAQIVRFLNENGYRTYRGSSWKANTVIKILKNEKYAGDLIQKKTYTPDYLTHEKKANRGDVPLVILRDHHEPIISRELWNLVQSRLQENNKHGIGNTGHSCRYAFSGKIRCGECGASFTGRFKYRKDGTKLRRWSCGRAAGGGKEACDVGKLVRDDDAMQMLKTAIRSLPMDMEAVIQNVISLIIATIASDRSAEAEDTGRIQKELERLQKKKEAVMDSYFSEEITKEEMQMMNRRYDGQMEEYRRKLHHAKHRKKENPDYDSLRTGIRSELEGILMGNTESEVFSKAMVNRLTVFKDRHMELRLNFLDQVFYFAE